MVEENGDFEDIVKQDAMVEKIKEQVKQQTGRPKKSYV